MKIEAIKKNNKRKKTALQSRTKSGGFCVAKLLLGMVHVLECDCYTCDTTLGKAYSHFDSGYQFLLRGGPPCVLPSLSAGISLCFIDTVKLFYINKVWTFSFMQCVSNYSEYKFLYCITTIKTILKC